MGKLRHNPDHSCCANSTRVLETETLAARKSSANSRIASATNTSIDVHEQAVGSERINVTMQVSTVVQVAVGDAKLSVRLVDGRIVSVPLLWFPRLAHGSPAERNHWRLIGRGEGIHWPDLDEDISIANLLAGKPSGESQQSLKCWLELRRTNG